MYNLLPYISNITMFREEVLCGSYELNLLLWKHCLHTKRTSTRRTDSNAPKEPHTVEMW